jgi:hypothetical protein
MNLFRLTLFMSLGGRAGHQTFSNSFDFETPDTLESDAVETTAENVMEAVRSSALNEVHFLRAHIGQIAYNLYNRPANQFRTVEFDTRGLRVVPGSLEEAGANQFNNPILTQDRVLIVKRETALGRSGQMKFRGQLLHDDVVTNLDGGLELRNEPDGDPHPIPSVVAELEALRSQITFVIPEKPGFAALVTTGREVTEFKFGGIATQQLRNHRRGTEEVLAEAEKRKLTELIRNAHKILGNGIIGDLAGAALGMFQAHRTEAFAIVSRLPLPERVAFGTALAIFGP